MVKESVLRGKKEIPHRFIIVHLHNKRNEKKNCKQPERNICYYEEMKFKFTAHDSATIDANYQWCVIFKVLRVK